MAIIAFAFEISSLYSETQIGKKKSLQETFLEEEGDKNMDLYNMRKEISSGKSIYDLPLKVTYYARVSSEKDEQLNSLSNQVFYFENHIKEVSNWTLCPRICR